MVEIDSISKVEDRQRQTHKKERQRQRDVKTKKQREYVHYIDLNEPRDMGLR